MIYLFVYLFAVAYKVCHLIGRVLHHCFAVKLQKYDETFPKGLDNE